MIRYDIVIFFDVEKMPSYGIKGDKFHKSAFYKNQKTLWKGNLHKPKSIFCITGEIKELEENIKLKTNI